MPNDNTKNFMGGFTGISAMDNIPSSKERKLNPFTGLSENDERIKLELGLPNFDISDLDITIENQLLSVIGAKNADQVVADSEKIKFKKSFRIPPSVNTDEISYTFTEKILSLNMPKSDLFDKSSEKVH